MKCCWAILHEPTLKRRVQRESNDILTVLNIALIVAGIEITTIAMSADCIERAGVQCLPYPKSNNDNYINPASF